MGTARLRELGRHDRGCADFVAQLLPVAARGLSLAYQDGRFAFTMQRGPNGPVPEGVSTRYSAIAGLGLRYLAEASDAGEVATEPGLAVLSADECDHLVGLLAKDLDEMSALGDVALLCWLAAEAGHSELPHAVDRLRFLDTQEQVDVVSAAWVITALVAARHQADVEQHLAVARDRLLNVRRAVFPHLIGGKQHWYRAHVGSFADQIYPVQALARLHASGHDPEALKVAEHVAGVLCRAQGPQGQWWWHYDSRTGAVVEGYPVYSVHQHAMAPMALLDLAEAGGTCNLEAISAGLRWLTSPAETGDQLVAREVIWRKVARRDPAKLVRGVAAARTAVWPDRPGSLAGKAFPPGAVDFECRPYELGWLLYAWLHGAAT